MRRGIMGDEPATDCPSFLLYIQPPIAMHLSGKSQMMGSAAAHHHGVSPALAAGVAVALLCLNLFSLNQLHQAKVDIHAQALVADAEISGRIDSAVEDLQAKIDDLLNDQDSETSDMKKIKEQVRYLDTAFSMVKVAATKTDEEQEATGQSGALSASLAANEAQSKVHLLGQRFDEAMREVQGVIEDLASRQAVLARKLDTIQQRVDGTTATTTTTGRASAKAAGSSMLDSAKDTIAALAGTSKKVVPKKVVPKQEVEELDVEEADQTTGTTTQSAIGVAEGLSPSAADKLQHLLDNSNSNGNNRGSTDADKLEDLEEGVAVTRAEDDLVVAERVSSSSGRLPLKGATLKHKAAIHPAFGQVDDDVQAEEDTLHLSLELPSAHSHLGRSSRSSSHGSAVSVDPELTQLDTQVDQDSVSQTSDLLAATDVAPKTTRKAARDSFSASSSSAASALDAASTTLDMSKVGSTTTSSSHAHHHSAGSCGSHAKLRDSSSSSSTSDHTRASSTRASTTSTTDDEGELEAVWSSDSDRQRVASTTSGSKSKISKQQQRQEAAAAAVVDDVEVEDGGDAVVTPEVEEVATHHVRTSGRKTQELITQLGRKGAFQGACSEGQPASGATA